MPDIFLYVSSRRLGDLKAMMPKLGRALRVATADSLPGIAPWEVEVRAVEVFTDDNATAVQILCIADASEERLAAMNLWALNLAKAWREVASDFGFNWINDVGVWPIMPKGKWLLATEDAIREMEES